MLVIAFPEISLITRRLPFVGAGRVTVIAPEALQKITWSVVVVSTVRFDVIVRVVKLTPPVIVLIAVELPIEVNEEVTTVEFKVVPDNVPAGAITALPLAAVINPLAFTVKEGIDVEDPKDPTLELTVASVVTVDPEVVVTSPVSAGKAAEVKIPPLLNTAAPL